MNNRHNEIVFQPRKDEYLCLAFLFDADLKKDDVLVKVDGRWRQVGRVNAAFQRQAVDLAMMAFEDALVGREWQVKKGLTEAGRRGASPEA